MATNAFPRVPSNLPKESQEWARRVEASFNDLYARLVIAERTLKNLGR